MGLHFTPFSSFAFLCLFARKDNLHNLRKHCEKFYEKGRKSLIQFFGAKKVKSEKFHVSSLGSASFFIGNHIFKGYLYFHLFFFVYFILLSSFPEALNTTKWWRSIKWEKVNYKNYSIWRFRRTQNEAEIEENDNFALVLMCNIVWKIFYTVLEVKA